MAKFVSETGNFLGTEVAHEQFTMRTLPLVPFTRERLLTLKEEQQENRRLCGRSYIKDYLEYVCVNEIGDLIKPHYVTESFPKLLKAKGMRQIRYHDLRHSCASLLLANGVPMKQIQEWLGHSDFSTTANIYAHLDSRRNAQWLGLCSELKKKSQQPGKPTTGVISGGAGGIRTHGTLRFN